MDKQTVHDIMSTFGNKGVEATKKKHGKHYNAEMRRRSLMKKPKKALDTS